MLWETLGSIRRLEDLPRLAGALGFAPAWRELPDGCLGWARTAVVGQQGEFEWYGLGNPAPTTVSRAARALAARGLPAAVLGLDEGARQLQVAAGAVAPLVLALDAPNPLDLARL